MTDALKNALYVPYREIGLVCDRVPIVINRRGEVNFLTIALGKYFQVIRGDKFITCLISRSIPDGEIIAIQVNYFS
jgi:hypothetical protein